MLCFVLAMSLLQCVIFMLGMRLVCACDLCVCYVYVCCIIGMRVCVVYVSLVRVLYELCVLSFVCAVYCICVACVYLYDMCMCDVNLWCVLCVLYVAFNISF